MKTYLSAKAKVASPWKSPVAALLLGALILLFDGLDLALYGVTLPHMRAYASWSVTPTLAGYAGSLAPLGMIPGALIGGYLSDMYGRRRITIIGLVLLSLSMFGAFAATSLVEFMTARFCTGIAVGALAPLALAIVSGKAPPRRHTLFIACAMGGLPVGGVIASGAGAIVLGTLHFQYLYLLGLISILLIPAVFLIVDPQDDNSSSTYRQQTMGGAADTQDSFLPLKLFRQPYGGVTIGLGLANLMALLLFYGASVWLPYLLSRPGHFSVGAAIGFSSAFFVGAFGGQPVIAFLADKSSTKRLLCACFAVFLMSLILLTWPQPKLVTLALLTMLGLGMGGAGTLLNAYAARYYPPELRGSSLGLMTAIGRVGAIVGPIYIGTVLSISERMETALYALILPGVAGLITVAFIPTPVTEKSMA